MKINNIEQKGEFTIITKDIRYNKENWIDLTNLVHKNCDSNKIDWIASVGVVDIKCCYNSERYLLQILDYNKETEKLKIYCDGFDNYEIPTTTFSKCKLGRLFNNKQYKPICNINDIITVNGDNFKVLDIYKHKKRQRRYYKCKCLKCGNIVDKEESNILVNHGCSVCKGVQTLTNYNDVATTHPYLVEYFVNQDESKLCSYSSNKRFMFKCPICEYKKDMSIFDLYQNGFSCPVHRKNNYPEKFIFEMLSQLNLDFQCQLSKSNFNWCQKIRYDFYVPIFNAIIEVHGSQHYYSSSNFSSYGGRTLKEEQMNDNYKEQLARQNGIQQYIILDARQSNMKWIKESVMTSKLPTLFDFSESHIDWLKCHDIACNDLVYEIADYYNSGLCLKDIITKTKLSSVTIASYLKKANDLNLCSYDRTEFIKRYYKSNPKGKKVKVLETGETFPSASELSRQSQTKYGVKMCQAMVSKSCRENTPYKGFHLQYIKEE